MALVETSELPAYQRTLAELGPREALRADPALFRGATLWRGELVCEGVAESLGLPHRPLSELL